MAASLFGIAAIQNNQKKEEKAMKLVNAWIFLNEDEPDGTNYNSPDSCY